jgi:hypothetical protein
MRRKLKKKTNRGNMKHLIHHRSGGFLANGHGNDVDGGHSTKPRGTTPEPIDREEDDEDVTEGEGDGSEGEETDMDNPSIINTMRGWGRRGCLIPTAISTMNIFPLPLILTATTPVSRSVVRKRMTGSRRMTTPKAIFSHPSITPATYSTTRGEGEGGTRNGRSWSKRYVHFVFTFE